MCRGVLRQLSLAVVSLQLVTVTLWMGEFAPLRPPHKLTCNGHSQAGDLLGFPVPLEVFVSVLCGHELVVVVKKHKSIYLF